MQFDFDETGIESYIPDRDLESTGVWFALPGGRKVLCRRAGGSNTRFRRVYDQRIRPHRREMERGTLDEKIAEEILLDVYVRTVFVDWSGFNAKDGSEYPFSEEAVKAFFTAYSELFQLVMDKAGAAQNFAVQEVEEGKKSSATDSNGS